MASKQARGTKRTCQNSECGARFYDLGHNPIVCPVCEEEYVIASSPFVPADIAEERPRSKAKKPEFVAEKAPRAEGEIESTADESLTDLEEAEESIATEEDETFLEEEEEEGGDIATVIGPVDGEEEP